jgi:hypothetical protein
MIKGVNDVVSKTITSDKPSPINARFICGFEIQTREKLASKPQQTLHNTPSVKAKATILEAKATFEAHLPLK